MRLINVSYTLLFITFICKTSAVLHPKHVSLKNENKTLYTAIQSTRKTLKRVRKWKSAHKAEVNLFKCVSKYFEYSVPGLRRRDDSDCQNTLKGDTICVASELSQRRKRHIGKAEEGKSRIINDDLAFNKSSSTTTVLNEQETDSRINTCKLSQIWDAFVLLARFITDQIYEPFLAPFWRHKLFSCGKDYAVSKFWAWVDAAPE